MLPSIRFMYVCPDQMDSAREDLCKDDSYDPKTAFKALDSFRHNRVIAYELYSYFDLHRIESTV